VSPKPTAARRQRKGKQGELFGRRIEAAQWRDQIRRRLEAEGEDEMAAKLAACGQPMKLWCRECGHAHECETKCSRKWCPSCAPKRGNERADRLRVLIAAMRWPMHITLTVPNIAYDGNARGMCRDLMLAFRRLRRLKLWSSNVKGGCYGIEVTDKGNGYHPHLHIVADCQWLALHTKEPRRGDSEQVVKAKFKGAAEELQAAWQFATGHDEHLSLWLRRCDSNAASEIVGYALKSQDAIKLGGKLGDVFRAMDAVRMCAAFGSVRGVKLPDDDTPRLVCPNGHSEWSVTKTIGREEDARRWNERAAKRRAARLREEAERESMAAMIDRLNKAMRTQAAV
jgi:Replication protein